MLERMRANPKGDWRIADVERVCRETGADLLPPKGGSHYKLSHPKQDRVLVVPAAKPIKWKYIRQIADYLDAVES